MRLPSLTVGREVNGTVVVVVVVPDGVGVTPMQEQARL